MNEITISGVYKNAWSRLHGAKGSIWSIAALMLLISLTIDWSVGFIRVDSITTHFWLAYVVIPAVTAAIIAPFYAGSFMVAILRARNEPINLRTGFQYKPYYLKVAVTWVIVTLLSELMLTIINIPAIANATGTALPYLDLIGYLFWLVLNTFLLISVPLVIDQNNSIGEALSASFRIIKTHWLRVFVIVLLAYLSLVVIALPAFISLIINSQTLLVLSGVLFIIVLIWLLPFLFLLGGDIYHRLINNA